MPDEAAVPYELWEAMVAKLLESMPRPGRPPDLVLKTARDLGPLTADVRAAIDQLYIEGQGRDYTKRAALTVWLAEAKAWPVPTRQELLDTDEALRALVAVTSGEELAEEVRKIPSDPEKVNRVAQLRWAIDQVTGIKGSSLWVVLVFAYWMCSTVSRDQLVNLGIALAVVTLMREASKD